MTESAEGGEPGLGERLEGKGCGGGGEELDGVTDFSGEVVAIIGNAYDYEGGEDEPPPGDVGGVLVVGDEAGESEGDDKAESAAAWGWLGVG